MLLKKIYLYRNTPKATFSKKVWIYNFQDSNYGWRPKDDLRYEREGQFGCTSFKDSSYFDNRTMVLVVGGHPNRYVEIYDVKNRKWDYGKFIRLRAAHPSLMSSE